MNEEYAGPDAAVFDLDGVVTFTAKVHAAAWKQLFDEYLRGREQRFGEPFRPFDADADYRAYVDGKPRYDRVIYLASPAARGVTNRAAAALPAHLRGRVSVRDLPSGALT